MEKENKGGMMGNETEILRMLSENQNLLAIILGVVIGGLIGIIIFK